MKIFGGFLRIMGGATIAKGIGSLFLDIDGEWWYILLGLIIFGWGVNLYKDADSNNKENNAIG